VNPTQRRALARRAAAWLVLACAAWAGTALAQATASSRVPRPAIEKARGEQCVADPAFMRLKHMDLLKHQRNETVHRGVRDPRASLKGCIECHASSTTGSVAAAPTDFCASCHAYAAVKVDCFECHASKPAATAALPVHHPGSARVAAMGPPMPAQGSGSR
jgi:hypothetical protein